MPATWVPWLQPEMLVAQFAARVEGGAFRRAARAQRLAFVGVGRIAGFGHHLARQHRVRLVDPGVQHRHGLAGASDAGRPGLDRARHHGALGQRQRHGDVFLDAHHLWRCPETGQRVDVDLGGDMGLVVEAGQHPGVAAPDQIGLEPVLGVRHPSVPLVLGNTTGTADLGRGVDFQSDQNARASLCRGLRGEPVQLVCVARLRMQHGAAGEHQPEREQARAARYRKGHDLPQWRDAPPWRSSGFRVRIGAGRSNLRPFVAFRRARRSFASGSICQTGSRSGPPPAPPCGFSHPAPG